MNKKNNYITAELDWAEQQLKSWKAYVDKNPIEELEDRVAWKTLKSGGAMPVVIKDKEGQIKCIQDTMERYLKLLEVVDNLREKEEAKIEARGKSSVSTIADDWIKEKGR